jgi:hypothetical protein
MLIIRRLFSKNSLKKRPSKSIDRRRRRFLIAKAHTRHEEDTKLCKNITKSDDPDMMEATLAI